MTSHYWPIYGVPVWDNYEALRSLVVVLVFDGGEELDDRVSL